MKNKLSIIIPIYNEKNLLINFFSELFKVFEDSFVEYIIIDDGSYDGSEVWLNEHIKPLSKKNIGKIILDNKNKFQIKTIESINPEKYSKVIFISHNKNLGKGAAVINGLKESTGNYLTILDADLEYDPRDSLSMFNVLQENKMGEVIFGSRSTSGLPHRHRYFLNALVSYFNTFLFNILFDKVISDIHCGQKIFTRNVYEKIILTSKDFSIDMDLGTQIAKANFNISEVGVRYYSRTYSEGKKISWIDGLLTYWYLFKFRFIKNNLKTNLMIYLSLITGTLTGVYLSNDLGNIFIIILGAILGAIFGTRYSFAGLFSLILGLLIGSQFGQGTGKILSVFIGAVLGIFFAKKFDNFAKKILEK